jgi:ATP-dependent Lhr-like helicase
VERLDHLVGGGLQRIGLSATQKPIDEVARLLVGAGRCDPDGTPRCAIVDGGHRRALHLRVEVPDHELGAIASHELRAAVYDRIAALVREHRTTIVFVNTRRMVERVAHALGERLGEERVGAHHGSMSRQQRLAVESGLKNGDLPVVVATGSLELGIDVGAVDLVCNLGAPRSLAQLLQRIGRSGHSIGAMPEGVLFPFTRDELVQSAAAVRAVEDGALDALAIPVGARDVLAQQLVATVASEEAIAIDDLYALARGAHPFRQLPREVFDAVLDTLADSVEFVVALDTHFSRTAEIADVLLPIGSFAETDGTFVNRGKRVQRVRESIPPPVQARPGWLVLSELLHDLGGPAVPVDASAVFTELASSHAPFKQLSYTRLGDLGLPLGGAPSQ